MNLIILYMLLAVAVFAGLMFLIRFAINVEGKLSDQMFANSMDKINKVDL